MTTLMQQEARETPQLIARQLKENATLLTEIAAKVRQKAPRFAITIGRGSSDHACNYGKYLLEVLAGLVTASAAPSVVSIYGADLQLNDALVIGISQSGQSPDICQMMEIARAKGAITIAIVNATNSPLAQHAEFVIPLWAGTETAVAATKSYITSLTAIASLAAAITANASLSNALQQLPETLNQALQISWQNAIHKLESINNTLVIARGFGFPIAQEAALKFKETAAIQAEAFSAAEVMHGPFALIKRHHPFLLFTQNDATLPGMLEISQKINSLGGTSILAIAPQLLVTAKQTEIASILLPLPTSLHPVLDPIATIQIFYLMVAKLAVKRGYNPDAPQNLQKITETI